MSLHLFYCHKLVKNRINRLPLSHNQRMENQNENQVVLTNDKASEGKFLESKTADNARRAPEVEEEMVKGVLLSAKDADEFRVYKRRKIMEEIGSGMRRSASTVMAEADVSKVCEHALRLKQAAIRASLARFPSVQKRIGKTEVRLDCMVGGNGETATKVKLYECKLAMKNHAQELTIAIAPSMIRAAQFEEICKELRLIRRLVGKKMIVKARVDGEWQFSILSRLARNVSQAGVQFFSVSYFVGCEKLRFDLLNGCKLEVTDVQTLSDFKKAIAFGAGRIVSECIWDIYGAWMLEADKMEFAKRATLIKEKEPTLIKPAKEYVKIASADMPTEKPQEEKPTIEPKRTEPLPASKILQKEDVSEQKPTAAGIESSDLKFM